MSNGTRVNAPETALRWREESAKALPPNGWQRSARCRSLADTPAA